MQEALFEMLYFTGEPNHFSNLIRKCFQSWFKNASESLIFKDMTFECKYGVVFCGKLINYIHMGVSNVSKMCTATAGKRVQTTL